MEGKERGGAKGGGDKIIKHFRVETQKKTLKTRRTCKNDKTYKTLNPPRSCLAAAVSLRKIVGLRRRSEKSSGDSCDYLFSF